MPITIHCAQCGKPKKEKPGRVREFNFCNPQCRGKWLSKHTRNRIKVQCEYCSGSYEERPHRVKRTRFCSKKCRNLSERTHYKTNCEVCNKEVISIPSHPRRFCSKECESVFKTGRCLVEHIAIVCDSCGKVFQKQPGRSNRKFCSRECYSTYTVGKRRKPRAVKECAICHESFTTYPSRVDHKYCKACDGRTYEYAYDRIDGEDHRWFLGGKDTRYGRNWEKQSAKARKRDNNRCVVCHHQKHYYFDNLPVHHIVPRRIFDTLESLEVHGNDLSNLITLCPSCHRKADHGSIAPNKLKKLICAT